MAVKGTSDGRQHIVVYRSVGDTFEATGRDFTSTDNPTFKTFLVDVSGDARPDLVMEVSNNGQTLYDVRLNVAGTSFIRSGDVKMVPFTGTIVAFADLDGDGRRDIVIEDLTCLGVAGPSIVLRSVPVIGGTNPLTGVACNVRAQDYGTVTYIKVPGSGYWIKPTFLAPVTPISFEDGTFSTNVTTGVLDPSASELWTFLVPRSYAPPLLAGAASLPTVLSSFPSVRVVR